MTSNGLPEAEQQWLGGKRGNSGWGVNVATERHSQNLLISFKLFITAWKPNAAGVQRELGDAI